MGPRSVCPSVLCQPSAVPTLRLGAGLAIRHIAQDPGSVTAKELGTEELGESDVASQKASSHGCLLRCAPLAQLPLVYSSGESLGWDAAALSRLTQL